MNNNSDDDLIHTNTFVQPLTTENQLPPERIRDYHNYVDQRTRYNKHYATEPIRDRRLGVFEDRNTRPIQSEAISDIVKDRYQRERFTLVSIDSRDRDLAKYPNPASYRIYLNQKFLNVKRIELISTIMPNTTQTINKNNNKIFWQNLEDNSNITDITYCANLIPGNYTTNQLSQHLENQMNRIIRQMGFLDGPVPSSAPINALRPVEEMITDYPVLNGAVHAFNVIIDPKTEITTIISRRNKQKILSLETFENSQELLIKHLAHTFSLGDEIILTGIPQDGIGGIPGVEINGKILTIISIGSLLDMPPRSNSYRVMLDVSANQKDIVFSSSDREIHVGYPSPFKLLFGRERTIGRVLGFALEHSPNINEDNGFRSVQQSNQKNSRYGLKMFRTNEGNINHNYLYTEPYLFLTARIPSESPDILTVMQKAVKPIGINLRGNENNVNGADNDGRDVIVNSIIAKLLLSNVGGSLIYQKFASFHKIFFDSPLNKLDEIDFEFRLPDNTLYDFRNSDHSFTILITEAIDRLKDTNIDTRTGIINFRN